MAKKGSQEIVSSFRLQNGGESVVVADMRTLFDLDLADCIIENLQLLEIDGSPLNFLSLRIDSHSLLLKHDTYLEKSFLIKATTWGGINANQIYTVAICGQETFIKSKNQRSFLRKINDPSIEL